MWAKQSTAATLIVGPILDSTGAEYTSAVIGDLSISKNGGTLTALASAATLTHIANGQYTLVLTTGNTDTLGRVQITCNKSTYQMPEMRLMIVPAMVFDSMILGSDRFDVNVTHVGDTAQTAGDIYGLEVTIASYIDTEISNIQSRLPAALVSGRIDASVGAMATDVLTSTALAASAVTEIQSGLSTLTTAQVNAEVLDVLQTDTFAELASVPAATSSLKDKLTWLFMWARNKATQTSTQRKLYADDTTTVVSTETVSDDGATYSKGEAS